MYVLCEKSTFTKYAQACTWKMKQKGWTIRKCLHSSMTTFSGYDDVAIVYVLQLNFFMKTKNETSQQLKSYRNSTLSGSNHLLLQLCMVACSWGSRYLLYCTGQAWSLFQTLNIYYTKTMSGTDFFLNLYSGTSTFLVPRSPKSLQSLPLKHLLILPSKLQ